METPYLSIVVASRNDNHGGDLNERTQACIDSLSNQAEEFNIPIEVVMVDWNPPAGKPLLHDVIDHSRIHFRSIIVPREIHLECGEMAKRFPLYQMTAKNVGIRRAKGQFVLATNVDIFFSNELMHALKFQDLEQGNIYRAYRYDAKEGTRSLDGIQGRLIRINLSAKEELCTNACGDFQLMHRDDWGHLRGYYEKDLFSIHIDSMLEYHAYYNGLKEKIFRPPKVIYHVEHKGGWVPGVEKSKEYNRMNDEKIKKLSYDDLISIASLMAKQNGNFHYNKPDWGFRDRVFDEKID